MRERERERDLDEGSSRWQMLKTDSPRSNKLPFSISSPPEPGRTRSRAQGRPFITFRANRERKRETEWPFLILLVFASRRDPTWHHPSNGGGRENSIEATHRDVSVAAGRCFTPRRQQQQQQRTTMPCINNINGCCCAVENQHTSIQHTHTH